MPMWLSTVCIETAGSARSPGVHTACLRSFCALQQPTAPVGATMGGGLQRRDPGVVNFAGFSSWMAVRNIPASVLCRLIFSLSQLLAAELVPRNLPAPGVSACYSKRLAAEKKAKRLFLMWRTFSRRSWAISGQAPKQQVWTPYFAHRPREKELKPKPREIYHHKTRARNIKGLLFGWPE